MSRCTACNIFCLAFLMFFSFKPHPLAWWKRIVTVTNNLWKRSLMDVCTFWAEKWTRKNPARPHIELSARLRAMEPHLIQSSETPVLSGIISLSNQPISKMLTHNNIVCTRWLMLSTSISRAVETLIKPQFDLTIYLHGDGGVGVVGLENMTGGRVPFEWRRWLEVKVSPTPFSRKSISWEQNRSGISPFPFRHFSTM